MTGHRDWTSIKAALNGIRAHDDENYIAARSRDYFWYSPILNEQLKDKLGELVVRWTAASSWTSPASTR